MSDLIALTDQDLVHAGLEAERDLVSARFRHSMNQLENTAELKELRRRIARIKTEMRNREIQAELPKDSLVSAHRSSFGVDVEAVDWEESAEKGGFLKGIVDKLTGGE